MRLGPLLLVAALVARLSQQFAVLLLGHPLATLFDDGTHVPSTFLWNVRREPYQARLPERHLGRAKVADMVHSRETWAFLPLVEPVFTVRRRRN